MRILYILHQFFPEFATGTERVTLNLAHCMQHAGHYVHVLACALDTAAAHGAKFQADDVMADYVWESVPVTVVPREAVGVEAESGFWVRPQLVAHLTEWVGARGFDIVHVMHSMRMASAVRAAQMSTLPMIVTLTDFFSVCYRVNLVTAAGELCGGPDGGRECALHCLQRPWTPDLLERRAAQARQWLGSASQVVVPSAYVAETMAKVLPELSLEVIPHGLALVEPDAESEISTSARAAEPIRFGYIGSIVPEKGLRVLLQAFSKVTTGNATLTVIGNAYGDTEYWREVQHLIAHDERVELVGELPHHDVLRALRRFDFLCVPSLVPETFSMVYHEAKAVGVPSLVSDVGAPALDIEQTGAGQVVSAGDIGAWHAALCGAIAGPVASRAARGAMGVSLRCEEEAFFYESVYRRYLPTVAADA